MQSQTSKGFAVVLLLIIWGCGMPSGITTQTQNAGGGPIVPPVPGMKSPLTICSKLDFSGVTWPPSLNYSDREALKLALNISGSFEGESSWANLTNNFDGEGLDLGLLNQTLGTGSLQPMLIQMRDTHMDILREIFDPTRLESLLNMLSHWENLAVASTARHSGLLFADNVSFHSVDFGRLSYMDKPIFNSRREEVEVLANNLDSVNWALSNLYTDDGVTFDSVWAKDLRALAKTPQYISIQIATALSLHTMAIESEKKIKVDQLRSYLLMFDINVQNGGMYSQDWTDYQRWLLQNPSSTDTNRLESVLKLRLRHVQSQYQADVSSRKRALIDGYGIVHGENRNLESEYCFNKLIQY